MITCKDISVDQIYVINLKRHSHRLDNMRRTFEKHKIDEVIGSSWRVVEAVDYVDKKSPANFNGPRDNGGAYGCTMSHLSCIDDAIERNLECVLIMEDDVMVHHGFREAWETIRVPADFNILYLSATQLKWSGIKIIDDRPFYKAWKSLGGTAYILKKNMFYAVKRMYAIYRRPIDEVLMLAQERHRSYVIYPNLLINYMNESSIRKNNKWKIETTGKLLRWDVSKYDTSIILSISNESTSENENGTSESSTSGS